LVFLLHIAAYLPDKLPTQPTTLFATLLCRSLLQERRVEPREVIKKFDYLTRSQLRWITTQKNAPAHR